MANSRIPFLPEGGKEAARAKEERKQEAFHPRLFFDDFPSGFLSARHDMKQVDALRATAQVEFDNGQGRFLDVHNRPARRSDAQTGFFLGEEAPVPDRLSGTTGYQDF